MVREFSEEQIEQYREDGILIVENLMSREVAATLAEGLRAHLRRTSRPRELAGPGLLAEGA